MIKEVKLPEVSDNIENGDVVKVLVSVGDTIEIDQPMIELETDKAMFEVPSTEKGTIKEINVKEGDVINIGQVILKVETDEESKENGNNKEDDEKEDSKEKESSKEQEPVKKEEKSKEKNKGNKAAESGKGPAEENSKKNEEMEQDSTSDDKKTSGEESSDEKSSDEKSSDKESSDKESSDKESSDKESSDKDANQSNKKSKDPAAASPSVRRLARELGVDISRVNGSQETGRITEEDIKKFVREKINADTDVQSTIKQKELPDFEKWGEVDIQPMSKVRFITGQTMTYAWTTVPMVTQFDKADITQSEEFRKKHSSKSKDSHLTITSILVKICSAALKVFPQFNSSIDFEKKEIIYKSYYNIGVAVDTDRGLLVPVLKKIDTKNLSELSSELNELAVKAREKKLTPEEMDGGNFTISNLGGIGGTGFTPIVYSPQVAILGVSRGTMEPVFINEKFEPKLILPLTLTYDHRIIDGANAARFLRWICEALENPLLLLM